jgi:hypothetical protein
VALFNIGTECGKRFLGRTIVAYRLGRSKSSDSVALSISIGNLLP